MSDVVIVIPARMGSTRFPGKPLADLAGKPMVQWVVEAARQAAVTDRIIVATPDEEIVEACRVIGAEAMITSAGHATGTDRIAEVATQVNARVFVNVQGDEPLVRPESIAACAAPMVADESLQMASVYCECLDEELDDPASVKVVTDRDDFALYFSRWAIPYERERRIEPVKKHLGLYAYTREALGKFSRWPQTPLERAESLEQLRFLENGVRIKMSPTDRSELAVDLPEHAVRVTEILLARGLAT